MKARSMKIDVVLLTKNSVYPCLNECVNSIYKNVPVNKLIVVDGGSTDGTLEFLQKFPDVEIIDDQKGTRATSRQKGIETVETEWHIHVDSDVILSPRWFEKAWKLVDKSVGAIWGVAIPIEKHFFNITYAMSKLYGIGIKDLLVKQTRSERCMLHDTLIRTDTVKDIEIPRDLHIWEDEYIGRHIINKGYKFLKVKEPYCLHHHNPTGRINSFALTGYFLKKYKFWTFRQILLRCILALPKSAWIYMVTRDFQAAKLQFLNYTLMLKGWLAA